MRTLEFARAFVRFDKSSPINGPWRDEFYPFVRGPLDAADDIRCKRLVIYKASSAMGTVLGQVINLKRIVCDVGDQKMVCQTDDDASLWSKTRGKEWVKANADAMRLLSQDEKRGLFCGQSANMPLRLGGRQFTDRQRFHYRPGLLWRRNGNTAES